ncbi:PREDICTED: uncharacterized protein LOC105556866 [Vollenhovia emeryi]|uniref:uncharacterized protein LOC105556866 n=1 Tax=Vollenhovia emeryi TaxID=411798 RepID=UPI0005F4D12B|nr:PREDICTED: uncharacterized protein LOC105556866 [Vollenhovia emeryi]
MNLDKNYLVFSWMLSNPEFALEMARLISRYDLSLEYAKSIQHALLWLNKLFDVKWRQLHNDRDYISRWRLLNLQRQAKFILDNLVAENQQQHEKPKEGNRSDIILNTEKIEAEEETLMENNKENLSETNKTEISKDKAWENIPSDYIISTEETQMNNSELLKRIKSDIEDKSLTTVKMPINENFNVSTDDNSIVNDTVISKIKTLEDKNLMLNKTSSKSNKFISTLHDNRTKDEKRFGQLENVSSISPREIAIGTLQKTDQPKSTGTGAMHGSLKNVTGILKTRRTLDVPISSKKNKEYDTKNRRVSAKNITGNHHVNEKTAIKLDNASAIDDILEAVDEVFPTDKSVEMLR